MKFKPQEEYSSKEDFEKYVCEFVVDMYSQCELETLPDRERWRRAVNLFNGKQEWDEFREDNDWMSRPFLHEMSRVIRRVAEALSNLVFEKEDFFESFPADPDNPGQATFVSIFEKIIKYDLSKINFESLFTDFCVAGGTTGLGILKVTAGLNTSWEAEAVIETVQMEDEKEEKRRDSKIEKSLEIPEDADEFGALINREMDEILGESGEKKQRVLKPLKKVEYCLKASVVDPELLVVEPEANPIQSSQFHIEKINKKFYELHTQFEVGVLDRKKKEELLATEGIHTKASTLSHEVRRIEKQDQHPTKHAFRKDVELLNYYGPLLGKDGRVIEEDVHFIVGNGSVLLRARHNPYWSKKAPYLTTVFSKAPFKATGKGVTDNGFEQQEIINELFAVFVDMLKLATYQPMVIDDTALRDPEEVDLGLYPGMVIKTFGKKAEDVFSKVRYDPTAAAPLFQTLEKLSLSIQQSSAVDVSSTNPASRARITASEIGANLSRSDESVLTLGRELDKTLIEPLVRRAIDYRLQFGLDLDSLEDLRKASVINEEEFELLKNIPKIERFNEIKQAYRIKVRGFRYRLERQVMLAHITNLLEVLAKFPPEVIQKIDFDKALFEVVDSLGLDADAWIIANSPADEAREENKVIQTGNLIQVREDEDHVQHLTSHSAALVRSPSDEFVQHMLQHVQMIEQLGLEMPELPPEVMQVLGLDLQPQAGEPQGLIN